jgi:hypothetical protein
MTAPNPNGDVDPRDALATVTDRFKRAHSKVMSHNLTSGDFLTRDCIQHMADLEELMGIFCLAHEVSIEVKI